MKKLLFMHPTGGKSKEQIKLEIKALFRANGYLKTPPEDKTTTKK